MHQCPVIEKLVTTLQERYGTLYLPYGTSPDEKNGTGFRIENIPATFSVLCLESSSSEEIDIQIESYPPGEYIYTGLINLDQFLVLVEEYRKPIDAWPSIVGENA